MSSPTIEEYVPSSVWYKQESLVLVGKAVGGTEFQMGDSSKEILEYFTIFIWASLITRNNFLKSMQ
jgi:hypothetical protein